MNEPSPCAGASDMELAPTIRRGAGCPLQRAALPGSQPQLTGAAPLRECLDAAAGRRSRQPPRRAHDTLQPPGLKVS